MIVVDNFYGLARHPEDGRIIFDQREVAIITDFHASYTPNYTRHLMMDGSEQIFMSNYSTYEVTLKIAINPTGIRVLEHGHLISPIPRAITQPPPVIQPPGDSRLIQI